MLSLRRRRLGELLIEAGLITEKELKRALDDQRFSKLKLGKVLVWRLRCISSENIIRFLVKQQDAVAIEAFGQTVNEKVLKIDTRTLGRET